MALAFLQGAIGPVSTGQAHRRRLRGWTCKPVLVLVFSTIGRKEILSRCRVEAAAFSVSVKLNRECFSSEGDGFLLWRVKTCQPNLAAADELG